MFATAARFVWCVDGGWFRLWRKGRLSVELKRTQALRFRRWFQERSIERAHIRSIHCFVSADWLPRGVKLVTRDGPVTVAQAKEYGIHLDTCYDALDLLSDTAWVMQLGQEMVDHLGVPLVIDDVLQL